MNNTWILVAHRGGARLFEAKGPGKGLTLLQDLPNPEGRLKNGEINSDRPGRAFDRVGGARHSMSQEVDSTDQVAQRFAKSLGERLTQGRVQKRFEKLFLVAEPRFLGELRTRIDPSTAAMVKATLDKDLGGVAERDLPEYLGEFVRL